MKSFTIKRAVILTVCLLTFPVMGFAATKPATVHHKAASVVACEGKKAGDAVTLIKKGKQVKATCQDVKGTLKAVVHMKKK